MERLAAAGATFENAYCNSPLCLPSRMSTRQSSRQSIVSQPASSCPPSSQLVKEIHSIITGDVLHLLFAARPTGFMTGRFGSKVASYDNASPLPSDAVTWAHRFRSAGYDVALAGKMHFCGLDQLHGFRENLSRDIHAELWMEDGPAFVPKGAADWVAGIDESNPTGVLRFEKHSPKKY
jgi:choline-sulfatase